MNERNTDVPPRLLDDFSDYCLYLSSNNVIEQRFSMDHFVKFGLTDRSFSMDGSQLKQLEDLIAQHKKSVDPQSELIKHEIEKQFLHC
ncbi:hypothetical protein LPAF129_17620 [Ligilactobacillus pabuli]|uniref:Uncharacterized protein n=1 Tax=Ligilactobacillus pabuli TaxID=2886039 RepID=A0ABQ5JNS9_9LACO|nr:hypothetical protein [Ligilactobacillus pabuli]GKS82076.1 hypothetical protein LPAF129_17620 [Ligilactobacillus pabuli]